MLSGMKGGMLTGKVVSTLKVIKAKNSVDVWWRGTWIAWDDSFNQPELGDSGTPLFDRDNRVLGILRGNGEDLWSCFQTIQSVVDKERDLNFLGTFPCTICQY